MIQRYGGLSLAKFNNQKLISKYLNCTCNNPELNSNKLILCSKLRMHPTQAEGQKTCFRYYAASQNAERHSGKRHKANRHNMKSHKANRRNAKRHNANRHNEKKHNADRYNTKRHNANTVMPFCLISVCSVY